MPIRKLAAFAVIALVLAGCTPRTSADGTTAARHTTQAEKTVAVASVANKSAVDAMSSLKSLGLTPVLQLANGEAPPAEDGFDAVSSDPVAGTHVNIGSTVTVVVKARLISVPAVTGELYADAQEELAELLFFAKSPQGSKDGSDDWEVVRQSPAGGKFAPAYSAVVLTLQTPSIVFSISGNGRHATVTYTVPDGTFDIEQVANAVLPWSKKFRNDGSDPIANISAQDLDGSSISCTIRVDGEVVSHRTSTGQYAIVTCSMGG